MKPIDFEQNKVLFGSDATEGIVAVEPHGESFMRLFIRDGSGVTEQDEPFTPFIIVEDKELIKGFKTEVSTVDLSGDNPYRFLLLFKKWSDCIKARTYLQKKSGESPTSPKAPYLYLSDPVHQFLLLTGKTLFKGISFKDIHQLALDIETTCAPGFEFSNPEREEDRIVSIALMDNKGYSEVLFGQDMTEEEILKALNKRISRINPDIILGHNLFNFDLEYISARAEMYGITLNWGRNGKEPHIRRSRFTVAERTIDYTRMDIYGRHIVDTLFLLQYYDVTARELESYGLKTAAQHFGLASPDRVYIDTHSVQEYFEQKPEDLKKYNLDDTRETLALSELLGNSFFLQARVFPYSYQNIFVRGNATKINALFIREYLRQRTSIPRPKGRRDFEGGYTDMFKEGVIKNVVHCDVASLYPSIMLTFTIQPSGDTLGVFLPLLQNVKTFRLKAKKLSHELEDAHERDYYGALQQTFKILINSFYGYLGTEIHHFSDPRAAGEVTRKGREIIGQMLQWLKDQGAVPVELDTDGIYFVPPHGITTWEEAEALVNRLSESLPQGIDVEMDGLYRAMLSYKMKNYALLHNDGTVLIRGSALRSRGMEKYLRDFLSDMIKLLLEDRAHDVQNLINNYASQIENHEIDISHLAKTETLSDSLETYEQKIKNKKRNPAAAYELALKVGRDYRAGDQVSYYVTGKAKKVRIYDNSKLLSEYDPEQPDENTAFYQAKLVELVKKFKGFLPKGVGIVNKEPGLFQ
jgi:DNA polymerase I